MKGKESIEESPKLGRMSKIGGEMNPDLLVQKLENISDRKKLLTSTEVKPPAKKEVKDEYEFEDDASRESTDVK